MSLREHRQVGGNFLFASQIHNCSFRQQGAQQSGRNSGLLTPSLVTGLSRGRLQASPEGPSVATALGYVPQGQSTSSLQSKAEVRAASTREKEGTGGHTVHNKAYSGEERQEREMEDDLFGRGEGRTEREPQRLRLSRKH